MKIEKQKIIEGSSYLRSKEGLKYNRVDFMIKYMHSNLAYKNYLTINNLVDKDQEILTKFRQKFKNYRLAWNDVAKKNYENDVDFSRLEVNLENNPLCIDIETAAICDLACPHCFREHIITPDKIMNFDLYKKIINSLLKMDVPSVKLNWRGEPLLNPQLPKFIEYAKEKGVLEVSINTNATTLNKEKSEKLIKSGLDLIIFSFDGGTKKTYEKLRPGRFKHNSFETVYNNIKTFSVMRKKLNSLFPISKIQMVLTNETKKEVKQFFNLFSSIVDDVTVVQYNERGGNLEDLLPKEKDKVSKYLEKNNLPKDTPHLTEANEKIYISDGRKPCHQIFQRLMITYDGRVGMCCHDWGARHCIGFVDKNGFDIDQAISEIENEITKNKKGFELLKNAKRPRSLNTPEEKVKDLSEIWNDKELNRVRDLHKKNKINDLEICRNCSFKDTYLWKQI